MGLMSRNKGKLGEREFAQLCQEHGFDVRRTAQCRGNTGQAGDVEGLPGVHVEVKRTERLNLAAAYAQSVNDAKVGGNGDVPIVAHRSSRQPWLVTMSAEDWLRMYGKSQTRRPGDDELGEYPTPTPEPFLDIDDDEL